MPSPTVSLVALICEFIGTLILAYTYAMTNGSAGVMGLAIWVCGLIGGKISGAIINPAITLAFALRKQNRLENFLTVVLYMLVQFAGGFSAGLLGWWTNTNFDLVGPRVYYDAVQDSYYIGRAIFIQIVGAYFLTQIVLMSTEKLTKLTKEDWVGCLLIGVTLAVIISWGANISGASYNPAIGFGMSIAHLIQGDNVYPKFGDFIWIYILFPYVGAILALVFHQFIFKKAIQQLPDPDRQELIG